MRKVWQLYAQGLLSCPPLEVYSIHFEINSPYPSYTISQNPGFDWETSLTVEDEQGQVHRLSLAEYEPGEDFWLSVRRLGAGQFQSDT